MKIKINEKNKDKINDVLNNEQKRCSVRTTHYDDVVNEVEAVQSILDKLMYKKNQVGVIATIDPNAQDFPGAYQGIPTSTIITVEKCPSGWFLIDCKRTYCCRASQRVQLTLTPDHEEAIINYVTAFKNWKG